MKFWIVLIFSTLIMSGCGSGGCECCGPTSYYECEGEEVGQLPLNDSTAYWLGDVPDSVRLSNNRGFSITLYTNRYQYNYNLEVSKRTESSSSCDESDPCSDYCIAERSGVEFKSADFILVISETRESRTNLKEIYKTKPAYGEVKSMGDELRVRIGNYSYATNFQDAVFKQRITLNNTQIDSVYEVNVASQNPKIIYLKRGFGLVGYILSNNEEWTITK